MSDRLRLLVAAGSAALLVLVATASVLVARGRLENASATSPTVVSLEARHQLIARSTAPATLGHVISQGGGSRRVSALICTRVYAVRGTVACLRPDGDLPTYQLAVLDRNLRVTDEVPLVGVPNRVRVSPSGRWIAWTVFVAGDSYNGGRFSTRVGLLDLAKHELVDTLEDYEVIRDGRRSRPRDRNFWGVTFATDDRHFYATMSTAGKRWLVQGDVAQRTVRLLRVNVECPSLSPDGTRIAFKSAIGGDPRRGWRLSVLDLTTRAVTPLAELRSVDDQAAWLDSHTVAYGIVRKGGHADVWSVPADGSGTPVVLIPDAESPAAL